MPRSRIGKIVQLLSTKQTLHKMLLFQVQSLKQFQLVSKTTSKQVFLGRQEPIVFLILGARKKYKSGQLLSSEDEFVRKRETRLLSLFVFLNWAIHDLYSLFSSFQ